MAAPRINGFTVAYTAVGGVILWSGIKGETLSDTFKGLLSGQPPNQNQQQIGSPSIGVSNSSSSGTTVPPGNTGATGGNAAANQAIAKILAAPYGWSTGTEWADLVSLWNQESGWSTTAENPSGAYGIPQALPATKMPASAQKSGGSSASAQISWGLAYIKSAYGDPIAAWAHEESAGWY